MFSLPDLLQLFLQSSSFSPSPLQSSLKTSPTSLFFLEKIEKKYFDFMLASFSSAIKPAPIPSKWHMMLPVSPFVEGAVDGVPASKAAKSTRALDNFM